MAEPIVWLLFERGEFTRVETLETVKVLQMYMVGLMPYGFAKLFSMFLYASNRHLKAAKIATTALVVNMLFSLILMQYMGAMGLALAGSIGGITLFILTVREVGTDIFFNILRSKYTIYFSIFLVTFGYLLYILRDIL